MILQILQNELNNRSSLNHSHSLGISDITNLQTELNNKSNTNHTHSLGISDMTN